MALRAWAPRPRGGSPPRATGSSEPLDDAAIAALGERSIPTGKLAGPDEVAAVIEFLASPAASDMIGTAVPVDAGYAIV